MYLKRTSAQLYLKTKNFSCLQIARAFGASDIIAVDVQDEKLQKAKIFGATHTINSMQEDAVERIRVCASSLIYFLARKTYISLHLTVAILLKIGSQWYLLFVPAEFG